jgi:hypothetical protein
MNSIDERISAHFGGRWWRRLRRSFELPDLVRDETAFAAIAQEMGKQIESEEYEPSFVAEGLIGAFLCEGEDGNLEDLFFGPDDIVSMVRPPARHVDPYDRMKDTAAR